MIPGGRGVSRQEQDKRQFIIRMETNGCEIQYRRDQHQAVEIQSMAFLQIARKTRCSCGAITFTDQKLWRGPAIVAGGVQTNKITHRLDILAELMPLLWLLPISGAAVACADRVDEDQVGF